MRALPRCRRVTSSTAVLANAPVQSQVDIMHTRILLMTSYANTTSPIRQTSVDVVHPPKVDVVHGHQSPVAHAHDVASCRPDRPVRKHVIMLTTQSCRRRQNRRHVNVFERKRRPTRRPRRRQCRIITSGNCSCRE